MSDGQPTQTERVIQLLRQRGELGLTPLDALDIVGSFRLGARIYDAKALIRSDEEIVTERFTTPSGATVARYVLRPRVSRNVGTPLTLWPTAD